MSVVSFQMDHQFACPVCLVGFVFSVGMCRFLEFKLCCVSAVDSTVEDVVSQICQEMQWPMTAPKYLTVSTREYANEKFVTVESHSRLFDVQAISVLQELVLVCAFVRVASNNLSSLFYFFCTMVDSELETGSYRCDVLGWSQRAFLF